MLHIVLSKLFADTESTTKDPSAVCGTALVHIEPRRIHEGDEVQITSIITNDLVILRLLDRALSQLCMG